METLERVKIIKILIDSLQLLREFEKVGGGLDKTKEIESGLKDKILDYVKKI